MKMRIGDMTIDQIVEFCNKRQEKKGLYACNECPFFNDGPFLDDTVPSCMFWEDGFNIDAPDKEVDVNDDSLDPIDIYNKFREEFPEMLEDVICWEYNRDLIGNKRIAIKIRRDPLTEERWIYDYEDDDMKREVCNK